MFCPGCGTQNVDGAQFCAGCGKLLENTASYQPNVSYAQPTYYAQPAVSQPPAKDSSKKLISLAAGLLFLSMLVESVLYFFSYTVLWKISFSAVDLLIELSYIASTVLLTVYAFGFYKKGRGKALFGLGHIFYAFELLLIIGSQVSYYFDEEIIIDMSPLLLTYLIIIVFNILIAVFTFTGFNNSKAIEIICICFFCTLLVIYNVSSIKGDVYNTGLFPEGLIIGTLLLAPQAVKKSH